MARKEGSASAGKQTHSGVLQILFGGLLSRIHMAAAGSAIVNFFCGYGKLQKKTKESFIVSFFRRLSRALKKLRKVPRREFGSEQFDPREVGIHVPSSLPKSLQTRISEAVEESVILEKVSAFLRLLLYIPLISYGVFLFAFGLATTVFQALSFFLQGQASEVILDLFTGLAIVLLSLPVMFAGYEPLMSGLKKSVIGSAVLHTFFGAVSDSEERTSVKGTNLLLFLAGVLLGGVTWLVSPMIVVILLTLLIVAVMVIFVPEAGLLLLLVAFPFMGGLTHTSIACGIAVLYVGACWLIKVLLGKRSCSLELGDALVLCFALLVFSTAFAGGTVSAQSTLLYLAMMFAYPMVSNLLRSKLWIMRCSNALILSSFAVSVIGLVQWVAERTVTSVFDSPLVLACYQIALIPLALSSISGAEHKREKFRYMIVLLAQIGCVTVLGSWLALTVCVIEVVGFCLLSSRKTLSVLLIFILLIPVAVCLLPLFEHLLPELSFTLSQGRADATLELLTVIGKAPLTGIGMSDALLFAALPDGTLGTTPELTATYLRLTAQTGLLGLLLFTLIVAVWTVSSCTLIFRGRGEKWEKCYIRGRLIGLVGVLVMGVFCYVWSDYRLLMLFWAMAGLFQAVRKHSIAHEKRNTEEDETVSVLSEHRANVDLPLDAIVSAQNRLQESNMGGNEQ